jgi:hypothetical protein
MLVAAVSFAGPHLPHQSGSIYPTRYPIQMFPALSANKPEVLTSSNG